MRLWTLSLLAVSLTTAGCHSTVALRLLENSNDLSTPNLDLSVENDDLSVPGADLSTDDGADAACTPMVTSCVGLCGPIFDSCLGKNVQCGACEDGGVCDLFTHTCGVPKTDCTSLGAECGVVKNSCGTRLTCPSPTPDCPTAAQECDSQTNRCVACDPAVACALNNTCDVATACAYFGYQCGTAWLGCGPETGTGSVPVECGSCDTGKTCNPFYNVCDPQCTPAAPDQLCADALSKLGVECGFISDGCGGRVHCPSTGPECQAGYGCAAQGEQNKCQPLELPVECVAAGRNCGDLNSVCGGKVHCGDCMLPFVCNTNGVCGPPCTPKTCAQLGNPQCGALDDGCMGTEKCADCPDATYTCLPNNTCCKKKQPSDFPAGSCGTGIDDGCGGKFNFPVCPSGNCTATTAGTVGTCCVDTACNGNVCNTTVTNTCTSASEMCKCNDPTTYCNGTPGTCVPKKKCSDYTANGADGQACSNGNAFDDGTGNLIECQCGPNNDGLAPHYCISGTAPNGAAVQGATKGLCCTDSGACGNQCNVTVANTCVNDAADQHVCGTGCGGTGFCSAMMCVVYKTCAQLMPPAGGAVNNAPCSRGPAFDAGNGHLITCNCSGSYVCSSGGMLVSSSGTPAPEGMCCLNTATCPAGSSAKCNVTGIPNNTCTGTALTCGITCSSGSHCSGANGTCVSDNNCSNIGVVMSLPNPATVRGGADGNPCNDNSNFYQKTGGGFFSCACTQNTNSLCVPDNAGEGVCTCTATTCSSSTSCRQNGTANGCGGTQSCACPGSSDVCLASGACCTPKNTCGSPPSGIPAPNIPAMTASCDYGDGCGGSVGTQCCPTTNPNFQNAPIEPAAMSCVPHSGANPAYGDCICTPTHACTDPGIHDGDNNGCGVPLSCSN